MARARRVARDEQPVLWRTVENLCIGAGLPPPRVHVVDSAAPNAFAVGLDPRRAAIGVSRGLLTLLDRRELQGVIAHELSHIGNHDIRLNTVLAALGAALRLPFVVATTLPVVLPFWVTGLFPLWWLVSAKVLPPTALLAIVTLYLGVPLYVFVVAPGIGLLLRLAVSRQREFLADADAVLLTRDPEGLALALAKIGEAIGPEMKMKVNAATAHLYVMDPRPRPAPWWERIVSTHPPIEERIVLLARIGSGISPLALQAAREAGARFRSAILRGPAAASRRPLWANFRVRH